MPTDHPVALVTGAAKRVGAEIARRLHGAGYDLALHHRRSGAEMAALAGALEAARPGSVLVLQAELADPAAPGALVQATLSRFATGTVMSPKLELITSLPSALI